MESTLVNANNAIIDAEVIHDSNNGGMRWGASEFNFNNSNLTAGTLTIQYADSVVNFKDSEAVVSGTVTNAGTINVSGASAISAKVSGNGWICMDNVALDADTNIQGGKVRFVNGTSTLDGAVINSNAFQVGYGAYEAVDPRETVADVVVNVTNNSYIHAIDSTYYGWSVPVGLKAMRKRQKV